MSNCPVCGKKIPPKNKIYCSQTCYSEYRQNYKTCVVCGKKFPDAKANPTKCCSPECSKIHRHSFSKVSQNLLDKKEEFWEQHQGTEHINAKKWKIQSPTGQVYEMTNLKYFIRNNPDLFDGTEKQVFDGFAKIKASKQGKRKNKSYTYKGWKLLSWSE